MALDAIQLRISTPTEPIVPGRGFYQLEEDSLYVQVGLFSAKRHFYSFLEGEHVRLEFDRTARLIFVEMTVPRRQWDVEPDLTAPDILEPADIRWLDFREQITDPEPTTNRNGTVLRLRFSAEEPIRNYYLAESIFVQVDRHDHLVVLWVDDIVDDLAGQEIGAFRKRYRADDSFFA